MDPLLIITTALAIGVFVGAAIGIPGMRVRNRCGFKTEFSLWSCDHDRGHTGAHHLPWDPRLPADLTRAEQEAFRGGLLEEILERRPRGRRQSSSAVSR